ncbi:nucleotidyltransferase family protein [Ideonella paludis]|uniref:Nucleotidyltransferase family protein n=1 Tax=Ideonella paludis TaxID=1233411 RepID=A0ABS5DS27_9BURK|nr:nucleotidyltransferase family protein [Ideonella paludis]MBQ0933958.1 nucleotidyltransferase family protein [Ideonella paludis]
MTAARRPPRAIVLAAGRGERMRPLTDTTPKPLLVVQGRPMIEWHLLALARAGVQEVVINTAWLEEQFPATLGDGSRFGLRLHYSHEGRDHGGALETAGGIAKALPWLAPQGDEVFWVVSGDVLLPGFAFAAQDAETFAASDRVGELWLTPNAPHHPNGDFAITAEGLATSQGGPKLTWASVGLFKPQPFAHILPGTRLALRPILENAIAEGRLGARRWQGRWTDVGRPETLAAVNAEPSLYAAYV